MVKKIRLSLDYDTYCVYYYEDDRMIANDLPPEWQNDHELWLAFCYISEFYDENYFSYNGWEMQEVGCSEEKQREFKEMIDVALEFLAKKNKAGKYVIENLLYENI